MNDLPWSNPDYFGETAEAEIKRFRRDVNRSAWSIVIILAAAHLLALIISFSMTAAAVRASQAPEEITIDAILDLENMSYAVFSFIVSYLPTLVAEVLLIVLMRYWCGFRLAETKMTSSRTQKPYSMCALGFLGGWGCTAVAAVFITMLLQLFSLIGWEMNLPEIMVPTPGEDGLGFILSMSYVCVIGPVLEEVIFRGYILNGMKKYSETAGILISALLFMMFHGNLAQTLTPFLLGIIFAFLTLRTGSLLPGILCHILHNALQIGMSFLPEAWGNFVFSIYAIIGIAAMIYFVYRYHGEVKELKSYGRASRGERIAEFMLTPGFIVFFIAYLVLCALYFLI